MKRGWELGAVFATAHDADQKMPAMDSAAPGRTTPHAAPVFPFTPQIIAETEGGQRIVRLDSEVTEKSAAAVESKLIALDREAPGKPIVLAINSPGGEVQQGLNII